MSIKLVKQLNGSELQRVALILAFGKPADIYLIDEFSSFLDIEYRLTCARAIKNFMIKNDKAAIIVDHDFAMINYLAD